MDRAYTTQDVYEQFKVRWFNQAAQQCAELCVSNYEAKELDAKERTCVKTCFKKQMVINAGIQSAFTGDSATL